MELISDRKIKIGLLGCGRISYNHLDVIHKLKNNFELVGVCDNNSKVAQLVADKYNTNAFCNYNDLLNQSIDVVVICTPSGLHAQQCISAANKGKHVITEKPMATNWHDGINMVNACNRNNVKLFVVKQNRFNETIKMLHRAIKENRFGKIYIVNSNVFWSRPQSYYDLNPWRGTWEMDGGAFMNQASHYLDILSWLFGPISKVQSITGTLARKIEAEDSGVINIKWKSGALGSVAVTMLTYPENLEGSITIIGEKGTAKIGGVALNKIEHWKFSDIKDYDQDVISSNYETDSVYGNGHLEYYQNIIDVFMGNDSPAVSGESALGSLELLVACYKSAQELKTIDLPLMR